MVSAASADHNQFLPALPTPLIQSIKATQNVYYCVNERGYQYPNFAAQVREVHRSYEELVGIKGVEVAWGTMGTTGCQVQHNMVEFSCNGCAAHIYYANWPVVIEYKPSLGYPDWRSAIAHELGHGLLGLHEQYKDSGGVIQCVYRDDTVMSCGAPYVRIPMPRDVVLGCSVIGTVWCGQQPDPVYPVYDAQRNCDFFGYWCYVRPNGPWIDPNSNSEWGPRVWQDDYKFYQYNYRLQQWFRGGTNWEEHLGGEQWQCVHTCW